MAIPVNIPNLEDKELYEVLRKISLLAVTLNEILVTGTEFPTSSKKKFFYHTGDDQLYFYTGTTWKVIG